MIYKAVLGIFLIVLIIVGLKMTIPIDSHKQQDMKLDFPFELVWEKSFKRLSTVIVRTGILISTEDYSQEKLRRLFTSYSRKQSDVSKILDVYVYTDRDKAKRGMELFFPKVEPKNEEEPIDYLYDANFCRDGDGGSLGYRNEWFIYKQDINDWQSRKTVVLKGDPRNTGPLLSSSRDKEKTLEIWETENTPFKISVTVFERDDLEPPQVYYNFEAIDKKFFSGANRVITFISPNKVEIPKNQIRFVNDKVGYFYMGWLYAVTLDAGTTWSAWDAELDLENWQCCDAQLIEEVTLALDGTGKMKIKPIKQGSGYISELYTDDYGKHWKVK
ncbi:MAG: hypothetical protein AB1757_25405 [Acidobacteriota bacterium]